MTNEELLVAMSDMMDQKLEEKLDKKLDEKLDQKLDEKLDQKFEEKLDLEPGQRFSEKLDQIFDEKLKPFDERLTKLELAMENVVVPGIQQLCAAYSSEFGCFGRGSDQSSFT